MGWTGVLYWLLARRLRTSWLLLAIGTFGILAAVTLMSLGAVYSRALAEGGLRHTLATTDVRSLNAQIVVPNRPLGPEDYRALRDDLHGITEDRVGYLLAETQRFGQTQPNLGVGRGAQAKMPQRGSALGRPFFLTGFQEHSRVVEGRWPQAAPSFPDGVLNLETVMGSRAAFQTGFELGDEISLFPFQTDPTDRFVLKIVGLAEPNDHRDEYWLNGPVYFPAQDYNGQTLLALYVPESAFFDGLGSSYPTLVGDFGWFLYFDTGVINAGAVGQTQDALEGLESDVNKRFPRSTVLTRLENTLADYQRELTLAKVPLYLFIALIVAVILYSLAVVMGLLARFRSEEAGLLRSRGASILQISGLLVLAEGIVTVVAVAIGPFLAWAIVRFLLIKTINPVGLGDNAVPVGFSPDMFVMAAIGGLLSFAVLVASALSRARQGTVESLRERARPPTVPFLHRYYIDLLFLAGLGLIWWQISGRGGFVAQDVTSRSLEVDSDLLFGPVLGLLAAALLILRFLPVLIRLLSWVVSRVGPPWAAFSLVRLARDPLPSGTLVVILMMAAALGVLGASFQSTLARSEEEQALYALGGDLVLRDPAIPVSVQQRLADVPGVRAASPFARSSVVLVDGAAGPAANLIGIDPGTLPAVAWFKDGFAGQSLPQLMSNLEQEQLRSSSGVLDHASGIPIPDHAESIGIWVQVDQLEAGSIRAGLNLWLRLRDSRGRYRNLILGDLLEPPIIAPIDDDRIQVRYTPGQTPEHVSFGPVEEPLPTSAGGNWIYLQAPLPREGTAMQPPLSLVAIYTRSKTAAAIPPGLVSFDDVIVQGPFILYPGTIIEGFEEWGRWSPLASEATERDIVEVTPQAARTGRAGLRFSWQEPIRDISRGIILPPGPLPLPVIGGPTFRVGETLRIRANKQVVPVAVQDVTSYFPTVDPSARPFLLVSHEDYRQYILRLPEGRLDPPKEMWLSPQEGVDRDQVIAALGDSLPGFVTVRDRQHLTEIAGRNPLAGGGWNGLTILGALTIVVAVVLTMSTHAVVAIRTGRVDLTVARALGFSRVQMFLSLALERLVVAAIGIGSGVAIGVWLSRWVLGFLDITAAGRSVIPPMEVAVQGWLLVLVLSCLAGAALLSLVFASVWTYRLKAPDVLRTGE